MAITVGVAWRRDGSNVAHQGDLDALRRLDNVTVCTVAWNGAATANGLTLKTISEIDVLVIPGGPHSNAKEISLIEPNPSHAPKEGGATNYAEARAQSELKLIDQARYLGMPILAICGGSWRLLENYGGSTIELGSLTDNGVLQTRQPQSNQDLAKRHTGAMDRVETQFKHGAQVEKGTLLDAALGGKSSLEVNSVHWAVAREGRMGKLPSETAAPYQGIDPANQLAVNARDNSNASTVEGFEGRFGAPTVGLQWHPEYQTPGGPKGPNEGPAQTESRKLNQQAMQYIVDAGKAYRARQDMLAKLHEKFKQEITPISAVDFAPNKMQSEPQKYVPYQSLPAQKTSIATVPRLSGETSQTRVPLDEGLIRIYLKKVGRKSPQMKPDEWQNFLEGKPLSGFRDSDGEAPNHLLLARQLTQFPWLQRYISNEDLRAANSAISKPPVAKTNNPWTGVHKF